MNALPEIGFLRLSQILQLIPVSKSTWYAGMKEGRYPLSAKINIRAAGWYAPDIYELIGQLQGRLELTEKSTSELLGPYQLAPYPQTAFIELDDVLTIIPVSKSSWLAGVASGIYPKPAKISEGRVAWSTHDIRQLIESMRCGRLV